MCDHGRLRLGASLRREWQVVQSSTSKQVLSTCSGATASMEGDPVGRHALPYSVAGCEHRLCEEKAARMACPCHSSKTGEPGYIHRHTKIQALRPLLKSSETLGQSLASTTKWFCRHTTHLNFLVQLVLGTYTGGQSLENGRCVAEMCPPWTSAQ